MRLVTRAISEKDGAGHVVVIPQDPEDMWHAYNLIIADAGDKIRSSTVRKVVKESSTGSVTSAKKRVTLTIEVEATEYDPSTSIIRVKG